MKKIITALATILATIGCTTQKAGFEKNFTGETLRVDYWAKGDRDNESAELISLTKTSEWCGPRENLVDTADLGDYRIVLKDARSGDTLYLSGFSTLFGEWRTTAEALDTTEMYWSVKTVPMPRRKASVLIECRDRHTMEFSTIGCFEVAPGKIRPCKLSPNDVTEIMISGGITDKVDLTFLAEGYRDSERDKFLADVRKFTDALFLCPPFDKRKDDFNVRAVMLASDDSGVDFPGLGIFRCSALNASYYTFGTDRYLTTTDMKSVGDATWDTPTDAVFILVNEETYGGGGIYNFYAIGSSDNRRTLDVFIHEFGHSFGALADEYFDSETAYEEDAFYDLGAEPWEPNITTLVDFDRKWKSFHDGLFEGGGYLPKGIYRPADHCMMRDYAPFCPACTRAIERNIDFLTDKK